MLKTCLKCSKELDTSMFVKNKQKKDGLHVYCKTCVKDYKSRPEVIEREKKNHQKWYHNNMDLEKQRAKEYYHRNKPEVNKKHNLILKARKKTDILYRMRCNLRTRLSSAVSKDDYKWASAVSHLGCSIEDLKKHLESLFQTGMSWENYGLHGWHIDHIVPLSLAQSKEELIKLCYYTNLQPLWAKDNLSKSNKTTY